MNGYRLRLQQVRPARRGWTDRWAPIHGVAYRIAEAVVLLALVFGLPALIWLMAPEGAAYPR